MTTTFPTDNALAALDALLSRATTPVLVDCYTPSCAPCVALAPILESFSTEWADQLQIEKIDVGTHPEIGAKFGIRNVPSLLLFKDGKLVASRSGMATRTQLATWLSANAAL